jgi:hypothetical protein
MIDGGVTAGEQLCNFLNHRLLKSDVWGDLEEILAVTGRSAHLVLFFRELAAVTLTGRIVTAGQALSGSFETLDDPGFRKVFTEHLRDVVGIPARLLDELFRRSLRAVAAAVAKTPASIARNMRAWATLHHPHCYICGTDLNFDAHELINTYTLEHIWPRAYGGDSVEENLLPACDSCNSKKKRHFATWVMPAVQSLQLGLSPTEQRLREIEGSYKFSLHYRAAQRVAIEKRITMKKAFLEIGPWTDVRMLDTDDVADFFNLANHDLQ